MVVLSFLGQRRGSCVTSPPSFWLCVLLSACGGKPNLALGTLPDGHSSFSTATPWQIYPGMPQATDRVAYYEIYKGAKSNEVGHMIVAQYNDPYWRDKAYQAILKLRWRLRIAPIPSAGLADQAVSTGPNDTWRNADILFVRCNAVVHVSMPVSEDALIAYAQQLGQSVEQAFC